LLWRTAPTAVPCERIGLSRCYNGRMANSEISGQEAERLQKVLAHAGLGSRRAIEALIRAGRVSVNGRRAVLGQKVAQGDEVRVDGRVVATASEPMAYYALHKPYGIVTTVTDDQGRATVTSLVQVPERVYPVGRLDVDSEGLVLLTNDGELAHRLTHPRHAVPKVYEVVVQGEIPPQAIGALLKGVELDDGLAQAAEAELLRFDGQSSVLRLTLTQGRRREIRRMCEAVGYPVLRLKRVAIGPLRLGHLAPARWRRLSGSEVAALRRQVGLPSA